MNNLKQKELSFLTTYRCSECLLVQNIFLKSKLNIYLICPNNHLKIYQFNKEFINSMRIDLSLLKCKICKNNNSLFYCKTCYFTFCQNCKLAHNHENIITLENIDEEQQAKYFCKNCGSCFCEKCINSNHNKESHIQLEIDINEIIEEKNAFLERKVQTINDVQSGKSKYFIYDNDLSSMNILLNIYEFKLKLYEDIIQMNKIGKFNCISLNNIQYHFLFNCVSYYVNYIFDNNDIYSNLKHCEKNCLYDYYLNKTKLSNDNFILEKMHKKNLIANNKNEFYLEPIMLQKYKKIETNRRRGIFDVYYDKNKIPIIILYNDNSFIFQDLNTGEKIRQLDFDEIKNKYVIDIIYFNHKNYEYLILKCNSQKEREILIFNINSNRLIFHYNDKYYSNSLKDKKHSNGYINDFSCCVNVINKDLILFTSTGSHIHIFDIKLNQLKSKIFCNSYINCLKYYKLDFNYILIGTEKDGCLCYNYKNSKFLYKFTNGYITDLLIDDFEDKKHIILSVGKGNFLSSPFFIYIYEFYTKKCIKIIQSFYDSEANCILLWNHNYLFVSVYKEMCGDIMIYDLTCERSMSFRDIYSNQDGYKNNMYFSPYKIKKIKTEKYGEILVEQDDSQVIIIYSKNIEEKQNISKNNANSKMEKEDKKYNKNANKFDKNEIEEIGDIYIGDLFD